MSVKATTAVWEQSKAVGVKKLVLLAIADHADPVGVAWPSVARLGKMCSIAPRNIQKHLSSLEELGELLREKNAGKRGTNRYQILLDFSESFKKNGAQEPLTESSPCQNRHPDDLGDLGVTKSTQGGDEIVLSPLSESSPEPSRTTKNREREPLREGAPPPPLSILEFSKRWTSREKLSKIFPHALEGFTPAESKLFALLLPDMDGLSAADWQALRCWFVEVDQEARAKNKWGTRWPRNRQEFLQNFSEAVEKVRAWWADSGAAWWARKQELAKRKQARLAAEQAEESETLTPAERIAILHQGGLS